MPIIAIFNQKHGVGKTTTCLNVAAVLSQLGKDPLIIDLDPKGHLTLSCGQKDVAAEHSIVAYFKGEKPLADLVQMSPSGVRIIASHPELSKIETFGGKDANIATRLATGLIEMGNDEKNIVLLDCCPAMGVLSLNALNAAKGVLLPVSADFLSMQGARRLDSALKVLEKPFHKEFRRRVVVTRFDQRRRLSTGIYEHLQKYFPGEICETRIVENVSLAESPSYGKDILSYAPHSPGARDYRALVAELGRGGFFS